MKNLLFVLILLMPPLSGAYATQKHYSTDWISVSGPEMKKRVEVAAGQNNATQLYSLWQQARTQKKHWSYAIALHEVVRQQPRNASAVATYSIVMLEILREYSKAENFARAKQLYFGEDLTPVGIRARMEQAKKLDVKQWPIWVAESQIIPFPDGSPDIELDKMGAISEAFARRALALENNSYTNSALAYALCSRSSWDHNPAIMNWAIIAASRASQMQPVSVQARAFLLSLYRDEKKDLVKAQQVRKAIQATVPPNLKLSEAAKAYLKQLEIS